MAQVVWTTTARGQLLAIRRYIGQDSQAAANRMVSRIMQATKRLEPFPRSARTVPEFGRADTRELIVAPYRVIYRIDGDTVRILAVRHGAQRLGDIPGI